MQDIFTYRGLERLFGLMKQKADTLLFSEWDGEAAFLLRHDVDFDLELAHKLAKLENDNGVKATFFVLTSCPSYNILTGKNRKLLEDMVDMGFEIGLHFDPMVYGDLSDAHFEEMAWQEARILEVAAGQKIKSIALHNPSIHGKLPKFPSFVDAYDPKYFSDECYISDSFRRFRGKDPYTFIDRVKDGPLQINLHPFHYSEDGAGYAKVVCGSIRNYIDDINTNFSINPNFVEDTHPHLWNKVMGLDKSL